ncbi:hypothetical protein Cgig2_028415 [Carnegiea gigantea]|uniref:J domain-containing protein n=1 Tax=Carnegiea gigantea TaxID=171969 RepID=A0A9Q1K1T5_9CARY|nr:hypothetical protein Cgig2_028415 [Carnegiea gigantea]
MKTREARLLLGFPPDYRPTPSQVKAAYKRKAWDVHPDRFPANERSYAESQFKMVEMKNLENLFLLCNNAGFEEIRIFQKPVLVFYLVGQEVLTQAFIYLTLISFIHTGYEDWSSKGSWRWKTTSFSRPALPLHYFGDSWTRRYIWHQGLQKADRSKPFT